jgi:hypothetical protein
MSYKLLIFIKIALVALFNTFNAFAMDTPPQQEDKSANEGNDNAFDYIPFVQALRQISNRLSETENICIGHASQGKRVDTNDNEPEKITNSKLFDLIAYLKNQSEKYERLLLLPDNTILDETAKALHRPQIARSKLESIRPDLLVLKNFCLNNLKELDNLANKSDLEALKQKLLNKSEELKVAIYKGRSKNHVLNMKLEQKVMADYMVIVINDVLQEQLAQLSEKSSCDNNKKLEKTTLVKKAKNKKKKNRQKHRKPAASVQVIATDESMDKNEADNSTEPNPEQTAVAAPLPASDSLPMINEDESLRVTNIEALLSAPSDEQTLKTIVPQTLEANEILEEEEEDKSAYYTQLSRSKKILANDIKKLKDCGIILTEQEIVALGRLPKEQRVEIINARIESLQRGSVTKYKPKILGLGKKAIPKLQKITENQYIAWETVENTLKNQFYAFQKSAGNTKAQFYFYNKVFANGDREFVNQKVYQRLQKQVNKDPDIGFTVKEFDFATEIPHVRGSGQKEGNKMYPGCHEKLMKKLESVKLTPKDLSEGQ